MERSKNDWMYDSYQDHSDLSGILDTKRDSSEEDEDAGDSKSSVGSGSTATLVDDKENRTPIVGSTPASRLSSSNHMNKKKDRVIHVSAVMDRNKELELTVFDLRSKLGAINKDLPWLMVDGKDHLAHYIQLKNDNDILKKRLQAMEENQDSVKEDYRLMMEDTMKQERDEQSGQMTNLRQQYERAVQENDALREELEKGESGRDGDRSIMSDGGSMWSERSRFMTIAEDKIAILEGDLKKAIDTLERERANAANTKRSFDELKKKMEEKEREWASRESIASLQETFYIGIDGGSRHDLMNKVTEQLKRIDDLEKEVGEQKETEHKMAALVKGLMKQRSELQNELKAARETSMSIIDNGEVEEILKQLLDLSEMNTRLQEECRRRGAMGMERYKETMVEMSMDEVKKELETTNELCNQYKKMGDRVAPIRERIVAMNKSIVERRSFFEGRKEFDLTGLSPSRFGEGSYLGSGTPGTPTGRGGGGQSRLLTSVLQKSIINAAGSADIFNCSHNTSLGLKHAKEKLQATKDSCLRLFEKLKGSYALFDEIRLALGGGANNDLAERMAALKMELDASMMDSGDAVKAIEVVENSMFELQSMLEISLADVNPGRFSDFDLSAELGRKERKEREVSEMSEQPEKKDATYSVHVTATGEKQDAKKLREKLSTLEEDYGVLSVQFEELKEKHEQMAEFRVDQDQKYALLHEEREQLYGEVESRREREEKLVQENQNLFKNQKNMIEEVNRTRDELKEENEAAIAKMQEEIDRLYDQAQEAARLVEVEKLLIKSENEREEVMKAVNEKEVELSSLRSKIADLTRDMERMKNEDKTSESKMKRLELEVETVGEKYARMGEEYGNLSRELEATVEREKEMEKKLQKYRWKTIEESEANRKENERDFHSTQTSLTMESVARMEWRDNQLSEGLNKLGRSIEEAFLKKGQYDTNTERCLDEVDVPRLVDIVVRAQHLKAENTAQMERQNEELQRYIEEKHQKEAEAAVDSRGPSPMESTEAQYDTYTSVSGVKVKYADPLRQLFFALTHVANNLVQTYKKAQPKMCSGGLSEFDFNRILDMMRDLRSQLNERYSQTNNKSETDSDAADAKMTLRMAVVMETNEKLKAKINHIVSNMRDAMSSEDKTRLLEKVVAEMADITKTLHNTIGVKQSRIASSSSAATASTRRV